MSVETEPSGGNFRPFEDEVELIVGGAFFGNVDFEEDEEDEEGEEEE